MTLSSRAEARFNTDNSTSMKLEIEWEVVFGGEEIDEPFGFIQTTDGGFAIVVINYTDQEFFNSSLIKYSSTGQQQWITSIFPLWDAYSFYDSNCLIQTADNGFVIASVNQTSIVDGNEQDVLLRKFNATGKLKWSSVFGGAGNDMPKSFIQVADGGFVLSGGTTSYNTSSEYGMWLVKTDSHGVPEWNRTIGIDVPGISDAVIQTIDGGYAVAGRTSYADPQTWLVKTDANGRPEWNKTYDGPKAETLIQNEDGSYVLGGQLNENYWLLKTDVEGNHLWHRTYDSNYVDNYHFFSNTTDIYVLLLFIT